MIVEINVNVEATLMILFYDFYLQKAFLFELEKKPPRDILIKEIIF